MIIQRTVIDPIAGSSIIVGEGAPAGTDAPTGSLYVRKDGGINNILYTKYGTGSSDWSVLTSGSGGGGSGATGPAGPSGSIGLTGATGVVGVQAPRASWDQPDPLE